MKNMAKALKALTIGITPFAGVIILLMAALAFTACPTEGSSDSGSGNTVTESAILGIKLPNVGDVPVTTISGNTQYTGTVKWSPDNMTFQPETSYIATITLSPTGSFTFKGVQANFFSVQGAATIQNNAGSGIVTAVFSKTGGTDNSPAPITNTNLDDVFRPKTDTVAVKAIDNMQYSGSVRWEPDVGVVFETGKVYTATVTLTAKRGWAFPSSGTGWTIGGTEATFVNTGGGNAEVKATFPVTTTDDTNISIKRIRLSSYPHTGALAGEITVLPTNEYTGTITWKNIGTADDNDEVNDIEWNGRFLSYSKPYAMISLAPAKGYTLAGQEKDFFEIIYDEESGEPVTVKGSNPANMGVVEFTFPYTEKTVNEPEISGLLVPVKDEGISLNVDNNLQYYGPVSWTPVPDNMTRKFEGGTQYTADVTLSARKGWTLYGVRKDFFRVFGSVSVSTEKNSGKVSATFPTTEGTTANPVTIDGLAIYLEAVGSSNPNGYRLDAPQNSVQIKTVTHDSSHVDGGSSVVTTQYVVDPLVPIRFYPEESSGKFQPGRAYTATFGVKARDGYTLQGVAANSFVVYVEDGIVAYPTEHGAGLGLITVNLGVVSKRRLSGVGNSNRIITGVVVPVKGNSVGVTKITDNDYIKGDGAIVWDPALPTSGSYKNLFAPNTAYTAKIKLTDTESYELDSQIGAGFFVPNSTGVTGNEGSLIRIPGAVSGSIEYAGESTAPKAIKDYWPSGGSLALSSAASLNPSYDKNTKTVSVTFNKTEPLYVTGSDLVIGIVAPVAGQLPNSLVTATQAYTGNVVWYDENNRFVSGPFKAETEYRADIELTPEPWYVFKGTEAVSVKGGGQVVSGTIKLNNAEHLTLSAKFGKTNKLMPGEIYFDSLPVTGNYPQLGVHFVSPENGLAFGNVTWDTTVKPSGNLKGLFGSALVYTAKFTLTVETDAYTIAGLPSEGHFTIQNADKDGFLDVVPVYDLSASDGRKLDLTVTFPATETALPFLSSADQKVAKVIPKAKAGSFHPETASAVISGTDVIDGTYYTGSISWYPAVGDTFVSKQVYIATIELKAKEGYNFAGITKDQKDPGATTPTSSWFSLEGGKKVNPSSTPTVKVGNYDFISAPLFSRDTDNSKVTVVVRYVETQTTISAPIQQPIVPWKTTYNWTSDIGEPKKNSGFDGISGTGTSQQYKVSKLVWSTGATGKVPNLQQDGLTPEFSAGADRFIEEWTFTGTYTVQEVGAFTFKGLSDPKSLFPDSEIVDVISTTANSSGVTTKVFQVGYTTHPRDPITEVRIKNNSLAKPAGGVTPPASLIADISVPSSTGLTLVSAGWGTVTGSAPSLTFAALPANTAFTGGLDYYLQVVLRGSSAVNSFARLNSGAPNDFLVKDSTGKVTNVFVNGVSDDVIEANISTTTIIESKSYPGSDNTLTVIVGPYRASFGDVLITIDNGPVASSTGTASINISKIGGSGINPSTVTLRNTNVYWEEYTAAEKPVTATSWPGGWKPSIDSPNHWASASTLFTAGKQYRLAFVLDAVPGYSFKDLVNVTVSVTAPSGLKPDNAPGSLYPAPIDSTGTTPLPLTTIDVQPDSTKETVSIVLYFTL